MKKNTERQVRLNKLGDGKLFMISPRNTAMMYELNSIKKGVATYTSVESSRTFTRPAKDLVYPVKQ